MMENQKLFKEQGYVLIKNAIPAELRDFVTQYALFDEMQDFSPDGIQVENAHSKYADPAMETMLLYLHDAMEQNTGLKLYPTYSFYRVYRQDDELTIHRDRPSCEISATLCFNYSYNSENFEWPIFMDGKRVVLEPGDMVIYKGCELDHWREKFDCMEENSWHVQGFFHYVDQNGPYAEYKFDKREVIGELHKNNSQNQFNTYQQISSKPYIQYTK